MPKITPRSSESTIIVKTQAGPKATRPQAWWKAKTDAELTNQVLGTAGYLKEQQQYRYRQAALYSRLYSNYPLYGAGMNIAKMNISSNLPSDRPTMNVIQSCTDTLVSRITQSKPRPMFLTDDGDYKQRKLAKQLNNFIAGEFYQTKAYELGADKFRDSCIFGSGVLKVFESEDKVKVERRLLTELLVDPNDAMYGHPRQMYELALVDRSVAEEMFPNDYGKIDKAEQAYPDNSADSQQTISDQIMIVEAWRLPSSKEAKDGRHVIVCSTGKLIDEAWEKPRFPFSIDHYSKRMLGYWGQGVPERLTGIQMSINKLLITMDRSINLCAVPRVWVDDGSKVVGAHFNNEIGMIGKYRGTMPHLEPGSTGLAADVYNQLDRYVKYAFQQEGVSELAATSQKPSGLNSGEAIRNYDDIQSDRFATTSKMYNASYEDLAYLVFDKACDIAKRTGKYKTVYPNKNGAKEIDLPAIEEIEDQQFIIQCFDSSALPREPAGRLQKITEMVQSGMIDIKEGRRLLDYPDLDQVEKLANAAEERILMILDEIVEEGKFTPPDPFMDLQLALTLSVQYYNLYSAAKLEEEKAQMLRDFNSQVKDLLQEAMQPPPQAMPQGQPQAIPQPLPVSDLMPQGAPAA